MSMGYENGDRGREAGGAGPRPEAEWNAVRDDMAEMVDAATERGWQFVESARNQATDYVDRRKSDVAQSVADVAHTLRDTGQTFEDRPHIRAFVDSAADGLDQLAGSIRDRSFAEIYEDIEIVMRRRPTTVAVASLAAGFLMARFLKASAEQARDFERRARASTGNAATRQGRPGTGSGSRPASAASAGTAQRPTSTREA